MTREFLQAGTRTIGRSGECASGEKSGVSTGDAVQLASSLKARLIEMETNQNEESTFHTCACSASGDI